MIRDKEIQELQNEIADLRRKESEAQCIFRSIVNTKSGSSALTRFW
jgi:hypothetical protein